VFRFLAASGCGPFLLSTRSSLVVSLSVYNADERHVLSWTEFLGFLGGYRNPYATVELFPKPSEVAAVVHRGSGLRGSQLASAASTARGGTSRPLFAVGPVDAYGGATPRWRFRAALPFEESSILALPVRFTSVLPLSVSPLLHA